mmetsp:Transcript_38104/g.104908  ORF Transcript_38104/g.104908 Transcript_38104/m.104908 type:complete len:373 (+) Transcript_38104:103-1221(+)
MEAWAKTVESAGASEAEEFAVSSCLFRDWVAERLWALLEVPADLAYTGTCTAWARIAVGALGESAGLCDEGRCQTWALDGSDCSRRRPLLRVAHFNLPPGGAAQAALRWAWTRLDLARLESVRLTAASAGGCTPRAQAAISSADGQNPIADSIELICSFARQGASKLGAWHLAAELWGQNGSGCEAYSVRLSRCAAEPRLGGEKPCDDVADVEASRGTSFAVLKAAAANGHVDFVRLLLFVRANVDDCDEHGCTALHWAAENAHAEACSVLLDGGAAIDARDDDDWTPLCLAAPSGHIEVSRVLLERRAGVNIPDEDLRSPLWWAAWKKQDTLVALLLECRADPSQGDHSGVRPSEFLLGRIGRQTRTSIVV